MVGVPGIEPGTSSLSGTRSNQLSYTPKSGGNRVRTGGPELAKLVLYQLSYAPITVQPGGILDAAHSHEQPAKTFPRCGSGVTCQCNCTV